jgi:hypothetical protein
LATALTQALKEAGCEVGWSDLESLAIEFLSGDVYHQHYISGRFETSEDMAAKIMRTATGFLNERGL